MTDSPANPRVSTVTFPRPRWRCLIMFQSWSQFQSWAFFVVVSCVLIRLLFIVLEADEIPVGGLVIGAIFGSLWSVVSVIPASFTISPSSRITVSSLADQLQGLNYIPAETRGGATVYRQNLSRFLRWDEGNVEISVDPGLITVSGAQTIVRRLHRAMKAAAAANATA